jgi:hypothetical protein
MASYNYNNNNNSQGAGFVNSAVENKGLFSRILRNLSNYGMNYDDMIIRNQVGIGINEDPYAAKGDSMYNFFSQRAVASILNRKSIPYLDRSYLDKRRILREYSIKDEIRDFISAIADESIVYNDTKDFCSPSPLSNDYSEEITDKYQEFFEKVYNKYGFSDSVTAYQMMKDFLIDGYIAIELVWDDKKKNIIAFNRLRPESIVPAYEPNVGHLWIQFPEDPQLRRIFLDSQIVFISYSSQNDYSETSYVEGLIKPYNQLKILEQTRIMFNIMNATIYQKFTIPIKGMSRQKAEEQIGQLIQDYSEEIEFDDTLGTINVNGSKHIPYNKQVWFPEGDAGTPNMELMTPTGHDLNDETMLKWFHQALKRASKIPVTRFEAESGGGTFIADQAGLTNDEVKFHNFIGRLRSNFKELIVKPIKLQMLVEFPELIEDDVIMNEMDIDFNSNQIFEEWKKINNLTKRAEAIGTLTGIMNGDKPYFHIEWIMDHVFKLTPEEKSENKKYWAMDAAGVGSGGAEAGAQGGPTQGGDIGAEMGAQGGAQAPAQGGAQTGAQAPAQGGGQAAPESPAQGGAQGGSEFEF